MKRLLILFMIAAAGAVAACGPDADASPSIDVPLDSSLPTMEPTIDASASPAMSVEPSTSP